MTPPTATYRIQFRDGMDFDAARALVPYLKRLGISHLYASPIFAATQGSTHGYDIVDHNAVDPALGGRAGFDRLSAALRAEGMGLLLDIVPNHMAASLENPWWRSTVEWGRRSPFAGHFDIDWSQRLTLPFLGKPLSEALAEGEIALTVDRQAAALSLAYFDARYPLHPSTYAAALAPSSHPLARQLADCAARAAPGSDASLRDAVRALDASAGHEMAEYGRDPALVEKLHALQPWQLTFWKDARHTLTYRRFFEVTGLVGVRVEDEAVFADVHRLTLDLVRSGAVDGLRVDHVDGLRDPAAYLRRLRRAAGPDTWIVVEKILEAEEELPPGWPVDGTTGYEFIDASVDLLADEEGGARLHRVHAEAVGGAADLDEARRQAKRQVVAVNFEGELRTLARLFSEIAAGRFTEAAIGEALAGLLVALPVYRTYGTDDGLDSGDRLIMGEAAKRAAADPALDRDALDFLCRTLSDAGDGKATEARLRFQQLAGPVMAKGVEDTLFYRDARFLACNEVGCDPGRLPAGPARFHEKMARRAETAPGALTATATHDTKRGEDARARLFALSEAPDTWAAAVARWRQRHAGSVAALPGGPAPEPEVEWLLYQALAGVWPEIGVPSDPGPLRARFLGFVEKALREAKLRTSWTEPNAGYEAAVKAYADRLLDPANRAFLDDFADTVAPFCRAGRLNSLAQTLVKLTVPGIPDIYQGTEAGDFSLVDPDNRRPPGFARLARGFGRAEDPDAIKQQLVARVLHLRREQADLFRSGAYVPLETTGARQRHILAFARRNDSLVAVVAVPRLTLALLSSEDVRIPPEAWDDTAISLPAGWQPLALHDALNDRAVEGGARLEARMLFEEAPVALLTGRLS